MTDLHESIAHAIARTRVQTEQPAAVLAAIKAEGYVLVKADRWERVRSLADVSVDVIIEPGVQPGDLDPSGEG
jgi:hypothetical protein